MISGDGPVLDKNEPLDFSAGLFGADQFSPQIRGLISNQACQDGPVYRRTHKPRH